MNKEVVLAIAVWCVLVKGDMVLNIGYMSLTINLLISISLVFCVGILWYLMHSFLLERGSVDCVKKMICLLRVRDRLLTEWEHFLTHY